MATGVLIVLGELLRRGRGSRLQVKHFTTVLGRFAEKPDSQRRMRLLATFGLQFGQMDALRSFKTDKGRSPMVLRMGVASRIGPSN